jgi:tetratricopeptide (TPR) repeat protein
MAVSPLWTRLLDGHHVALLGAPVPPAPARPHRLVSVDCAAWHRPLGPLLELRKSLEAALDRARPSVPGAKRPRLSDEPEYLVTLMNRLQRQLGCPVVVAVLAIDAADAQTIEVLERVVVGPTRLRAAVLIQSGKTELRGRAGALVAALVRARGPAALVRVGAGAEVVPLRPSPLPALDALSFDAMRVLRAGAAVGDTFEADLVAGLLALDPFTVLELCQLAIDSGVALEDRGRGIFRLPPGLGHELRARTTPSLASAWHAELAAMMAQPAAEEQARQGDGGDDLDDEPLAPGRVRTLRDLAARWHRERDFASRAAEHAAAAGDRETAVKRFLDAALEAAQIGGHERAVELCDRALASLPPAPSSEAERRLRLAALRARGRILWLAAGVSPRVRLQDAVDALEQARQLLREGDPGPLRADIIAELARVYYDVGDLDRALAMLRDAQQLLLDVGDPLAAARLLNDEAAVLVRRGEVARAADLLARSRDVFRRFAGESAEARRELAYTDHLVARLPLHGAADEIGRAAGAALDEQALAFAVECAEAAQRAYEELGDERERARAGETLGRLARLRGDADAARGFLSQALATQQQLGDAVGLARTTAALAELLADGGRHDDALRVLGDSVALNLQTGSRQGLSYNKKGLDELQAQLGPNAPPALTKAMRDLRDRLDAGARA